MLIDARAQISKIRLVRLMFADFGFFCLEKPILPSVHL